MEAAKRIVEVSPFLPYFHVDDMHVTGHVAIAVGLYPPARISLDFLKQIKTLNTTRSK